MFCIPESFNKNMSHQHFAYKINSGIGEQKFKGDFVLKNKFETFVRMIFDIR